MGHIGDKPVAMRSHVMRHLCQHSSQMKPVSVLQSWREEKCWHVQQIQQSDHLLQSPPFLPLPECSFPSYPTFPLVSSTVQFPFLHSQMPSSFSCSPSPSERFHHRKSIVAAAMAKEPKGSKWRPGSCLSLSNLCKASAGERDVLLLSDMVSGVLGVIGDGGEGFWIQESEAGCAGSE